jgi:hypothetical protein
MTYDPANIFAKILKGELPCHKVYEDDTALAMMDIFPQSRGHTLIVPKAASRNLLDADPAALAAVMPLVQRVTRAVKAATGADGIRLAQFRLPQGRRSSTCISTSFPSMKACPWAPMAAARPTTPSWLLWPK